MAPSLAEEDIVHLLLDILRGHDDHVNPFTTGWALAIFLEDTLQQGTKLLPRYGGVKMLRFWSSQKPCWPTMRCSAMLLQLSSSQALWGQNCWKEAEAL